MGEGQLDGLGGRPRPPHPVELAALGRRDLPGVEQDDRLVHVARQGDLAERAPGAAHGDHHVAAGHHAEVAGVAHGAADAVYSVCSAMGYARNLSVVASGDVVIAVGGAWGTPSEIALARNVDKPVILLDTWEITPPEGGQLDGVRRAKTPAEAVELALS